MRRTCTAASMVRVQRARTAEQWSIVNDEDERLGEVGMAYVVARTGTTVDPDALMAWCWEEMANYKVPRYVEVVDALNSRLTAGDQACNHEAGRSAQVGCHHGSTVEMMMKLDPKPKTVALISADVTGDGL